MSHNTWVILRRELRSYFATPIAYVFIIIFLFLSGIFTFYIGSFFARGQADLLPFFQFHPWLYLFLIPALAMRVWAEERKTGSIELLLTLPVTVTEAVLGKFLAAWAFTSIALALTFPMWLTVNYLGNPDNMVILAGYLGSLLMAGAFLSIGMCMSALTKNQVVAFIITAVVCLMFILSGYPVVLDFFQGWAPQVIINAISSFSFLTHFDTLSKGVIDVRNIIYFVSLMAFWLFATAIFIEMKKAD